MGAAVLIFEDMRITFLTVPFAVAFVLLLYSFRDPRRGLGAGVVSPADGRVLALNREAREVTISVGVRDAHVNRAPLDGRVVSWGRHPRGRRSEEPTQRPRSAQAEWTFSTPEGPLRLVQIGASLSRPLEAYVREGDRVRKGERIGVVPLRCRVRVVLPPRAQIVVASGDRVRAGETTLAEIRR